MPETAFATPAATTPPRRRWLRWPLRLLVGLVALVLLAPFALHLGFVRDALASRLGRELGTRVTIGSASGWWTGVTLEDLAVESPAGHTGRLLQVARVKAKAALGALLGGRLDATVELEQPRLWLTQDAAGRWNADDLGRDRPPRAPRARAPGAGPTLALRLSDGVVEVRRAAAGSPVERVSGIEVSASLAPDEAFDVTLAALVEGAGAGGAHAAIEGAAALDAAGRGPVRLRVPALDLARVAGLVESASGLSDMRGTVALDADGTLEGEGGFRGHVGLTGSSLAVRTAAGARLAIASLTGRGDVTPSAAGDSLAAAFQLTGLEAADGPGPDARTLSEPEVNLAFEAQRTGADELRVKALDLSAGTALSLRALTPLVLRRTNDSSPGIEGQAQVSGDLARLGALKGFVPQLASLRGGRLAASLEARPGPTLDVGLGARIVGLDLAPGDLVPGGYADGDVTVQAGIARDAVGGWIVRVHRVQSALAALASSEPFELRWAPDGAASLAGTLNVALSLDALSRGWGSSLGLPAGERLGGLLRVVGTAQGGPKDGGFQGRLELDNALLPASWSKGSQAGPLAAQLTARWGDTRLTLEVADFEGLGIAADARATFDRAPGGLTLSAAQGRVELDLAQLRARLGGLIGLEPAATLAGRALVTLEARPAEGGTRLQGTTQASAVAYRAAPAQAPFEERALVLEHTVLLRKDGGLDLSAAKLRGNGYEADLSGSSRSAEGDLAVAGNLKGDAAVLAERVKAFLGADGAELKGEGRVAGRVSLHGRGGDLLASGIADVDLELGTWSNLGATLAGARLAVRREVADRPYAVALTGTLNGGAMNGDLALTPEAGRLPFRLGASFRGVDMGSVLTRGRGARGLAFVLPTLVPLDGATPALSGRMNASIALEAQDLSAPLLTRTLVGRGEVSLTEGTLGQSSLFGSLSRGGLGDVGRVLQQVAPQVGREVAGFTRSVSYQQVTSRFRIASERVEIESAQLSAPAHRLDLQGTVGFDQRVDLAARLWLGSKAGEELKRVLPDQTIPLRVKGTLDEPQVVPDLNSADLLKAAAGALPKPKDLLDDPKGALDRAKKELEERLKGLRPK